MRQKLLSHSFLIGSVVMIAGNAIAAEVPTVPNTSLNLVPTVKREFISTQVLQQGEIAAVELELTPTQDWKMGYVSQLSETLPTVPRTLKVAQAEPSSPPEPKKWGVGVHAQGSTTGFIGVDAGYKFSPNLHGRLGLNTVGFRTNYSSSGIDYSASLSPTNLHLLGDYFPFGGGLRLTGGFIFQNNSIKTTSKSDANNRITINNTEYDASQLGTVEGDGKFGNSVAPYLGIGFGTPISPGFGFNIDAGVMFAGSPNLSLRANNISAAVPAAQQAQIRSDLAEQERKTNQDIKGLNLYPVISIGFSYGF